MPSTSNFGWSTPADTDLVKDGALAIRTLGNNIDSSLVDLKGGTTGQILAKNSNTDLDYTWINNDQGDITAVTAGTGISGGGTSGAVTITNSMATEITAKGDLIVGTGNATFDNLAAGSNGDTLVADSTTTTGLRWQADWNVGKNKIINGDFNVNQRAFSSTTTSGTYTFDRWSQNCVGGTVTTSAQTFTLGTAPVAGYEARNFIRQQTTGQTLANSVALIFQKIESVRTFANQTVTVSFWAKANSGTPKIAVELQQNFGTGGTPSTSVNTYAGQVTLSQAWTRFSVSTTLPSISGKTIGTNNDDHLALILWTSAGSDFNSRTGSLGIQTNTFDIWGVQVEAGSVATPFTTATGSLGGELALCQRYFYRTNVSSTAGASFGRLGACQTSTIADFPIYLPVPMRSTPTNFTQSNLALYNWSTTTTYSTGTWTWNADANSRENGMLRYTHGSGVFSVGQVAQLVANASTTTFFSIEAEL